jgi:hypothetical protein
MIVLALYSCHLLLVSKRCFDCDEFHGDVCVDVGGGDGEWWESLVYSSQTNA